MPLPTDVRTDIGPLYFILEELRDSRKDFAGLGRKVDLLMEAITNFSTKAEAYVTQVNAALENIRVDIAGLKEGNFSPEDQAKLDAVDAKLAALADAAKVVADSTPDAPAEPPTEPVPPAAA